MSKGRIDERNIMFARSGYKPGTPQYEDYYRQNPDLKEGDDVLRGMPEIFGQGTATYHPQLSPFGDAGFRVLAHMKDIGERTAKDASLARGNMGPTEVEPLEMTGQIREFARFLGCSDVGFTGLSIEDMYSFKGRGDDYGKPIETPYPHGIVLVYQMALEHVNRAPQLEQAFEVVKAYTALASAALWLTAYIQGLGYRAKAHIDGNYEAFLPPLAMKAGLGEVGRATLFIHPTQGMRVRLALISTDLPLVLDGPVNFGIKEFCKVCQRCVKTCPGKALTAQADNWKVDQALCYGAWRRIGTDCGVCLSSCPFSQGLSEGEWDLLNRGLANEALAVYEARHPLKQYLRETAPLLSYPKPPIAF